MKKFLLLLLLVLIPGLSGAGDITTYNVDGRQVRAVRGEILVKFKEGTRKQAIGALHSKAGTRKLSNIKGTGIEKIKVPEEKNFEKVLLEYKKNENVKHAEPNLIYTLASQKLPGQYDDIEEMQDRQWGLVGIQAHYGWAMETGSEDVVIAIVDTGVNYAHPDLKDNMWDGEDNHGYNFVDGDDDPMDTFGHGTHVAGIAGGVSNSTGAVGVAWECSIMAVKVADGDEIEVGRLLEGIKYAADEGADIINLSLGGDYSSFVADIIGYAYEKGCFIVAASGNEADDSVFYPAALDNVLAVGASDENDERAWFSNYGSELDIVAPGVDIYSATFDAYDISRGTMSGTSMAAPFAAGTAALVISGFEAMGISWHPDDIKWIINSSARRLTSRDWDVDTGYGLLDAYLALGAVQAFEIDRSQVIVFPNPFDPRAAGKTNIRLETEGDDNFKTLEIFSLDGQLVREFDNTRGKITYWDGRNEENRIVAPGLYFFMAETEGGKKKNGKITVLMR